MDAITKQVELIKKRGLGGNDQLVKMMKLIESQEHALAEKDREIQQIREHEYQRGYQEGEAVMLAQAVRFATYLRETIDSSDIGGLGMYEQVQAFLKEHP